MTTSALDRINFFRKFKYFLENNGRAPTKDLTKYIVSVVCSDCLVQPICSHLCYEYFNTYSQVLDNIVRYDRNTLSKWEKNGIIKGEFYEFLRAGESATREK